MNNEEFEQWRVGTIAMLQEMENNESNLQQAMGMLAFELRAMTSQVVGWSQLLLEDPIANSMTDIVIDGEQADVGKCLTLILKAANRINAFQAGMADYSRERFNRPDTE